MLAIVDDMHRHSRLDAASVSPRCLLRYVLVLKDPGDPLYHLNQVNATMERPARSELSHWMTSQTSTRFSCWGSSLTSSY